MNTLTKISELKIGQKVWYFTNYGDLHCGKITELVPNELPHSWDKSFILDSVTINVENWRGTNKPCLCGVCAKQTMIYTSKPNKNEYIDDRVEFESDCFEDGCSGTINGLGWCDDDGIITKFDYQECDSCGWNQGS